MLEAEGYDPSLPLHSGPTPAPRELKGGPKLGGSQGRSRERVRASRAHASWGYLHIPTYHQYGRGSLDISWECAGRV